MIVCCGEALIDMIPCELGDGRQAFLPQSGGAALNTAIALGRLGAPCGLLAGLSNDMFGRLLEECLAAACVDRAMTIRSDRPTTLAFAVLENGNASYAFHDENSAGRMLAPGDLPPLGGDIEALFFTGVSLATEPCGTTFEGLMTREFGRRLVMLDPNIRPAAIADEDAYRARLARLFGLCDILKLSLEDLAWLGHADPDAFARDRLEGGCRLIVVTQGADGAIGYTRQGSAQAAAPKVDVADTVGAGDTFDAALLFWLARRGRLSRQGLDLAPDDLSACLAFAARAASIIVGRAGAEPPWRAELAPEIAAIG